MSALLAVRLSLLINRWPLFWAKLTVVNNATTAKITVILLISKFSLFVYDMVYGYQFVWISVLFATQSDRSSIRTNIQLRAQSYLHKGASARERKDSNRSGLGFGRAL